MNKIIFVFSILMTFSARGAECTTKKVDSPFAKLEAIADSPFIAQKNCLRSLADAPTTPPISKQFFKKIGDEEVYAAFCYLPDGEDFSTFMFLTDKGLKALKLPVYHFTVPIYNKKGELLYNQSASLPGDITHFKYESKDYYIRAGYPGESQIMTYGQVPALASELGMSMSRVDGKIKKYEDYLKGVDKISAINVSIDPAAVETVVPCLLNYQQQAIETYMFGKFKDVMPAYGTLMSDHNNFNNTTEETKKKYARSFDSLRSEIQKDVLSSHPLCVGILDDKMIETAFDKHWGKNKSYFEGFRKRLGLVSP
jgi:hypothetical protein